MSRDVTWHWDKGSAGRRGRTFVGQIGSALHQRGIKRCLCRRMVNRGQYPSGQYLLLLFFFFNFSRQSFSITALVIWNSEQADLKLTDIYACFFLLSAWIKGVSHHYQTPLLFFGGRVSCHHLHPYFVNQGNWPVTSQDMYCYICLVAVFYDNNKSKLIQKFIGELSCLCNTGWV